MMRSIILLVVLQGALAVPQVKGKQVNTYPFPTCPLKEVDASHPVTYATLEDSLTFAIRPNEPVMYMRIIVDNTHYKASVSGTMIELLECSSQDEDCQVLNQGGSKNTDFLFTNTWNIVTVSFTDNRITVDINMRKKVMGLSLAESSKGSGSRTIEVSIVATDPTATIRPSPTYTVRVNIKCNDTYTPEMRTAAPLPTPLPLTTKESITILQIPIDKSPFNNCSWYQVEMEHPTPSITFENSLTLAIYPTLPLLYMHIRIDNVLFKAIVERSLLRLLKCDSTEVECSTINERDSQEADLLLPKTWNTITISIIKNMIEVDVNMRTFVKGNTPPANFEGVHSSEVTIVANDQSAMETQESYYIVGVNVECNDTFSPTIRPVMPQVRLTDTPFTDVPLVTQEQFIATSTPSSGKSSAPVGIIIGVLVALVLIIAAAVAISVYKKRRSADINQHTPLREQQQVQARP